jgi:hypothetical protein
MKPDNNLVHSEKYRQANPYILSNIQVGLSMPEEDFSDDSEDIVRVKGRNDLDKL